ncbi:MAG: hypothetical protein IKY15_01390 [Clostridia bacterium]|nr:hypothetical protein [Clostridia bacterium]
MEKKLSKKKVFVQEPEQISPQLQAKIEAEYRWEYKKQLEEYKKHHGEAPKGMYARWFDSDMWMMHEGIKARILREEKNKKKGFLRER